MTVATRYLDTCDKLPGTLALLAVLSPSAPTLKLSPLPPGHHTHEKRYQALCVLCVTENGVGLGNEAEVRWVLCGFR